MAAPKTLRLEFVTPERAIAHEDIDEVELPGENGFFGVLPGHAALLASDATDFGTGQVAPRRRPHQCPHGVILGRGDKLQRAVNRENR